MTGQDQSVNLSGMLTDIGKTMGSMGDAYKPVLKGATKPRGDMNDPAHLANLAQWASSHGDSEAASMYMTQSRDAKAKAEKARTAQGQSQAAGIMQQITDAHTAEGVDPFQRKANVRALEEQLRNTATEYNMDATRFVGYGDAVASQAMQKEQAENAAEATRRANGQRATIERLNGFMAKGDTTALENALVSLEDDGQSTLAREYRSGMQNLEDAVATRDDANAARSEKGNHNRPLTAEEQADAKKYGIKPEAYPSIGAARSKINDQRVAEAKASMTSKASKTIAVGVIEDMMPGILRELESEASNLDGLRFTPGNDGLADYINEELMDNEALMKEIAAFVSTQGPQQGADAAARIRQLVLEDLARRTKGSDGFIEKMFGGGIEADIRTLSPAKSADSYL
jgi:hypothetical protein